MSFLEKNTRTIRRIPFVKKLIRNLKTLSEPAKKAYYLMQPPFHLLKKPEKIKYAEIRNKQEYFEYCEKFHSDINKLAFELDKKARANKKSKGFIKGYCMACENISQFKYFVTPHENPENPKILFGNVLECRLCRMSSRLRYMIHMMKKFIDGRKDLKIYAYEQVTVFYSLLQKVFGADSTIIGSEYLKPELQSGTYLDGIRHEDALNLSFKDESLDFIISNEVFEHVPDLQKTFDETYRVLKKGGYLLFTAPFSPEFDKSVVRAKIENGEIIYLMEKEIHGNPLGNGSLAFYNPGWDMMDMQKQAGFKDPYILAFSDKNFGYINFNPLLLFVAQK